MPFRDVLESVAHDDALSVSNLSTNDTEFFEGSEADLYNVTIPETFVQSRFWPYSPDTTTNRQYSAYEFLPGTMADLRATARRCFSTQNQLLSLKEQGVQAYAPDPYDNDLSFVGGGFTQQPHSASYTSRCATAIKGFAEPSITLERPQESSLQSVDAVIERLAVNQQADVVVLDALDLAAAQVGPLGPGTCGFLPPFSTVSDQCDLLYRIWKAPTGNIR